MNKPTRRSFFMGAGGTFAASLVATGAAAPSPRSEQLAALLAALEDQSAIRGLHQRFVRLVNSGAHAALAELFANPGTPVDGSIRSLAPDADVAVTLADDGTATARVTCTVETATPIESCGTLVEMARLQGDGVVQSTERRVLESAYVKRTGIWMIERVTYLAA
jgi:hypothetical protein